MVYVTRPIGLAKVQCTIADLTAIASSFQTAQNNIASVTNSGNFKNTFDLLSKAKCEVVGLYLTGPIGAGKALPPGQQKIIDYFESEKWNRDHPAASMHPVAAYNNNPGGAVLYSQAELRRLGIVIDEINKEIERRKQRGLK